MIWKVYLVIGEFVYVIYELINEGGNFCVLV